MDLNVQQQRIIEHGDGVIIVNAGPGTGKTKTLTKRIEHLITQKHVNPENILALTFTNRAAREMKERLGVLLKKLPTVTTFHGLCYDFLKQWGETFEIITAEQQDEIVKKILKEKKSKTSPRNFALLLTMVKNSIVPFTLTNEEENLIHCYSEEMKRLMKLDFDDLIVKTYETLKTNEEQRNRVRQQFHYILVDEFQDSNALQYGLIKLMANSTPSLFLIGDPLQSIYGFRGAHADIFHTIKRDFPEVREEYLHTNYRSNRRIVEVSTCLFPSVRINAHSQTAGKVCLIETLDEYSEAEWIVRFISDKIGGSELLTAKDDGTNAVHDFSDFAIIYRTHTHAIMLGKKLQESGLPYQIVKEEGELEGHRIKLLSMHAAKGLEFKYVCICGFEEGLIPHQRKWEKEANNIEEEKRLLYVAMTRAKEELYFLHARKRNKQSVSISRFHKFLQSPSVQKVIDPAIEKILRKREVYKNKKSQMTMF